MRNNRWLSRVVLLAIACGAGGGSAWADDDDVLFTAPLAIAYVDDGPQTGAESKILALEVRTANPYWLGMQIEPLPPALAAQLKLDAGVLVADVVKDEAAAKAGVKVNDVLMKIGDKPVKKVAELSEAVKQSGGKPLKLKLLHAGEELSVEVTPGNRGEPMIGSYGSGVNRGPVEELQKQLQQGIDAANEQLKNKQLQGEALSKELQAQARRIAEMAKQLSDGEASFSVRIPGPARVAPPTWELSFVGDKKTAALPEDVSIVIRKEGKKPAQIEVKQGDKSWAVSEDKLDELPPDMRKAVEAIRSGNQRPITANELRMKGDRDEEIKIYRAPLGVPAGVQTTKIRTSAGASAAKRDTETVLNDMSSQLERLQSELKELRKELKK